EQQKQQGFKPSVSAFDMYLDKVFCTIVYMVAAGALCSAVFYTAEYYAGNMVEYSGWCVMALDIFVLLFLAIALYITWLWKNRAELDLYVEKFILRTKVVLCCFICFQWNYISYALPSRELWGYSAFYALLVLLFFDHKTTDALCGAIFVSMIVSWHFQGELLMPANDGSIILNTGLRIVCVLITFTALHLLSFFGNWLIGILEEAIETDPLTGLLNRNRMEVYKEHFFSRAKNGDADLSMAVIDIDDFKAVNDTYTHTAGDEVLKRISAVIRAACSENEHVFRWGGEEMLVLSDRPRREMVERCESIRSIVEGTDVMLPDGRTLRVTVTVGVASYSEGMTLDDIFGRADNNLYIGKRGTKNIVIS
ncbi:MAG: GGDEF domain-containing protein, partial [Abditibacteriota bacterium]|nr:GGDEF domain-containing protein [Abditibacteriota bacterium]